MNKKIIDFTSVTERQLDAALKAYHVTDHQPPTAECPSLTALACLASGRLEQQDARRVRNHIFTCERCAALYCEADVYMQEAANKVPGHAIATRISSSWLGTSLQDLFFLVRGWYIRHGVSSSRIDRKQRTAAIPLMFVSAASLALFVLYFVARNAGNLTGISTPYGIGSSPQPLANQSENTPSKQVQTKKPNLPAQHAIAQSPSHSTVQKTHGSAGNTKEPLEAMTKGQENEKSGSVSPSAFVVTNGKENRKPLNPLLPHGSKYEVGEDHKKLLATSATPSTKNNKTNSPGDVEFVKPKELNGTNPVWIWQESMAGGSSYGDTPGEPQNVVQISARATRVRLSNPLTLSWIVPKELADKIQSGSVKTTIFLEADDDVEHSIVVPAAQAVPGSDGIVSYPIAGQVSPGHSYRWAVNLSTVGDDDKQEVVVARSWHNAFFQVLDESASQKIAQRLAAAGANPIRAALVLLNALLLDEAELTLRGVPKSSPYFKSARQHLGEIIKWREKGTDGQAGMSEKRDDQKQEQGHVTSP